MEEAPSSRPVPDVAPVRDPGLGARMREAIAGPPGWLSSAPVTRAILWANAAVFAYQVALTRSAGALASVPERVMLATGANYAAATVAEHRYDTLVTSCFLHFSLLHIGFNLYALRQIGPPIERAVGSSRLAPMYLVSGIVGSAASTAVGFWTAHGNRVSAGASGAICGIIGAALVLGFRAQGTKSPLARAMARWLGMLLVIPIAAGIAGVPFTLDNTAHFGGAATGGLFAALWKRGAPPAKGVERGVLIACALVVIIAFTVTVAHDRLDPFATMRAEDRYEAARSWIHAGRCPEARAALTATTRLAGDDPAVIDLASEYRATCGGGV